MFLRSIAPASSPALRTDKPEAFPGKAEETNAPAFL